MDMTQPQAAAPMSGDPTSSGASGAPGGDQEGQETITITPDGQGGWSVDDGDGDPPVACKAIGDVIKAVHDMLSGTDDSDDAASAWKDEASKRDGSGMPSQGGGPSMTMP